MSDLKIVDGGKAETKTSDEFQKLVVRHRIAVAVRTLLIAAAIIAAAVFAYSYYRDLVFNDYVILSKTLRSDADTAKYLGYNGHILKYSTDGAEAFNGDGTAIWNLTYEMSDPKVATCGDYVAIGNTSGTKIYVADPLGNQTEIDTKLPVLNFSIASQGVVAASIEDKNETLIELYDKTGEELARLKCSMDETGYPLDLALSPGGKLLGVSYLRMTGDAFVTSLAFYNFGDVGANEIDNLVSGYDYENVLFPRIRFLDDAHAVAIGDSDMVFFSGTEKPVRTNALKLKKNLESVFFGKEAVGLVYRAEKATGTWRLNVFDPEGTRLLQEDFDIDYLDILLENNQAVIYNDRECMIYNRKGHVKFDGHLEDPALLMVASDSPTRFSLVSHDIAELIRFK